MGKDEIQESEPLRIYLNEIGEIPLLDETEEKELGRRISDGDESARAKTGRRESSSRRFYRKTLYGKRFAVNGSDSGRKYRTDACCWKSMTIRKKTVFQLTLSWWIKEAITRAIDQQSREIRVPVHVAENMKRVQKAAKELQQEFGRKADTGGDCRRSWAIGQKRK